MGTGAFLPLKPPTVSPGLLVRNLSLAWRAPEELLQLVHARQGDIVRVPLGPAPAVYMVFAPELVRRVLIDNWRNYPKKVLHDLFRLAFGEGLIFSDGELWRRQRRMIQPLLSEEQAWKLLPIIEEKVRERLQAWEAGWRQHRTIEIEEEMLALVRGISVDMLFGEDLEAEVEAVRGAFLAAARPAVILRSRHLPAVRRLQNAFTALESRVGELILETRARDRIGPDLLSRLANSRDQRTGQVMSDRQLLNEAITLLFTGYETVAQALTWIWYLLATNPLAEGRLHAELGQAFQGGTPTAASISRLGFLTTIIEESLRLYPPSWANGREAIEADRLGRYSIPAGSRLMMCQYVVHRSPEWWPNPEGFDPDRFGGGRRADVIDFAYFPFGLGPRRCVGYDLAMFEMKAIVALIAREFRLRLASSAQVEVEAHILLRPRGGIRMLPEPLQIPPKPTSGQV